MRGIWSAKWYFFNQTSSNQFFISFFLVWCGKSCNYGLFTLFASPLSNQYQTNLPISLIIFAIISQNPICDSFIFRIRSYNAVSSKCCKFGIIFSKRNPYSPFYIFFIQTYSSQDMGNDAFPTIHNSSSPLLISFSLSTFSRFFVGHSVYALPFDIILGNC